MYFLKTTTILALFISTLFWSCSSNPAQSSERLRAPLFENKINSMKSSYLEQCLAPLSRKEYSERGCAFKLLTSLERSYGISFSEKQLLIKANELFFDEVEKQLVSALSHKGPALSELKRSFRGKNDALNYLKSTYSFSSDDLNTQRVD